MEQLTPPGGKKSKGGSKIPANNLLVLQKQEKQTHRNDNYKAEIIQNRRFDILVLTLFHTTATTAVMEIT